MSKLSKKIICYLLVCILSCSFVVGNAETITDSEAEVTAEALTVSAKIQEIMSALKLFGIIPEYYDYNVPIASEVTRADFAAAVARLMGKNVYTGSNVYFYDVPKTHWAYNEISNLAEMAVINGSGTKMFYPDTVITKSEAYKILLSVMGYGLYAEYNGGFPAGYIRVANKIDITKGVSGSDNLTMSDMFYLIYNAMKTDVMEPVVFGDSDMIYDADEGVSIMSVYRNVYYRKGVVNGANTVTVTNGTLNKGDVLIDDVIYKTGDVEMFDYIGQYVEFFYHQSKAGDDKTILWAISDNKNEVLDIEVDHSASFNKKTFEYTYYDKNDRKRTINIDRGITLIYNGGVVESGYDEIFNKDRYSLRLVKRDDKFTVAIVKEYVNYVAGSISALEFKIFDMHKPTEFIVLKEDLYDTISIKMSGLTEMKFEDIKQGSVLSVFKSKNGKHIEVVVNNNIVFGTVEQIKTDKWYNNILLSETIYRMDKTIDNKNLSVGDEIEAYLDVKGEIAYLEIAERKFEGAFLIDLSLKEGLENVLSIKYLAQNGKVTISEFAERVTIDGKKFKNAKEVENALVAGKSEFESQFALILKNSENKIKEIDTAFCRPGYETKDTLSVDAEIEKDKNNGNEVKSSIKANSAVARIGYKIIFDADSVIFSIPKLENYKTANESDFAVISATGLTDNSKAYARSYKVTEESGISKYILLMDYQSLVFENPIIVEDIGMGVDDEGNSVEVLNGYQGSVFGSVSAPSDNSDLFSKSGALPGTLVMLGKNNNGIINECKVLYDYRKVNENMKSDGELIVFSGYVNNIVGDVLKIGYSSGSAFDFAVKVGTAPVVIYDKNSDRSPIYAGSVGDAVTSKNDPVGCSKVVVITYRMQCRMILIYK